MNELELQRLLLSLGLRQGQSLSNTDSLLAILSGATEDPRQMESALQSEAAQNRRAVKAKEAAAAVQKGEVDAKGSALAGQRADALAALRTDNGRAQAARINAQQAARGVRQTPGSPGGSPMKFDTTEVVQQSIAADPRLAPLMAAVRASRVGSGGDLGQVLGARDTMYRGLGLMADQDKEKFDLEMALGKQKLAQGNIEANAAKQARQDARFAADQAMQEKAKAELLARMQMAQDRKRVAGQQGERFPDQSEKEIDSSIDPLGIGPATAAKYKQLLAQFLR